VDKDNRRRKERGRAVELLLGERVTRNMEEEVGTLGGRKCKNLEGDYTTGLQWEKKEGNARERDTENQQNSLVLKTQDRKEGKNRT